MLGHIQRGGTPERLRPRAGHPLRLCTAIDAVTEQRLGCKMVALRGTDIVRVPLVDATSELKLVTPELYAEAEVFFG